MPSPLLRLTACLLACVAGGRVGLAQTGGELRRPTFLRVVDAAGEAVVGAEVTVVGGLPHLSQSVVWPDVQRIATDKRGRAIAKLREDYCYVAWVVGPAGEHGRRLVGDGAGYFSAGALVEIVCRQVEAPSTFEVEGLDAWAERGPLQVVAMTAAPGDERLLERRADGDFDVPLGPYTTLEVRLSDGAPLWSSRLMGIKRLPPPAPLTVRTVDEGGAPLAGVEIVHRVARRSGWAFDGFQGVGADRMRVLGVSDADGLCEVVVPYDDDPLQGGKGDLMLLARAPGRPTVAGGIWNGTRFVDDQRVARFEGEELRFTCPAPTPLVGVAPGAPRGTIVHLGAACKLHMQGNGFLHDPRTFTAEVGANGRFELHDVPRDLVASLVSMIPPPESTWQPPVFPPSSGRTLPPELQLPDDGVPVPFAFGSSEVRVLDMGGGPALGAVVFVLPRDLAGTLSRDAVRRMPLGSRGDVRMNLLPGHWVAVVVTERAFGYEVFEVTATGADVSVGLRPMASMRVRLRAADGKPVAGAGIQVRGSSMRGTDDSVQMVLQSLRKSSRAVWEGLRTDADGALSIPFLPVEGVTQRLDLRWQGRSSEEFALEADAELELHEKR
ncbi:MAG: hypothetical protein R3F29_12185 [Planctomycetota bacterium]